MDAATRIERALSTAVARVQGPNGPPKLAEALHYAVFPRGARIFLLGQDRLFHFHIGRARAGSVAA